MNNRARAASILLTVALGAADAGVRAEPPAAPPPEPSEPEPRGADASVEVYAVPLGEAPLRGGPQPKVTLVMFGDFQCPFSKRASQTLSKILPGYGADVALSFRHDPLPFHQNAEPAALAAEAARAQGKFWEMFDQLYANQLSLEAPDFERFAQAIGLDVTQFRAALARGVGRDRLKQDAADAKTFGVTGTPTFFINGRKLAGAQPAGAFKRAIDEEIAKANVRLATGTPRAELYAAAIRGGLKVAVAPAPEKGSAAAGADVRYRADVRGAFARGPKDALVTIVEWSDFQCPFCARVLPALEQIMREYKGQVRLVWRDLPLPFHPNARPAAIAARAAGAQGKFWEMHDRIYDDQAHLDRETFEDYAQAMRLDLKAFDAAVDSQAGDAAIDADIKAGNQIGARGTPTFFINGRMLIGAQPFDAFKAKIDEELKTAKALVAHGTPRDRVYIALMRDARTAVAPPPAPESDPSPENDTTIHVVDPTHGPSKGPAGALLQVVIFSDFQCPFCARVEPTLAQLEKAYGKEARFVWKNYPLPFHQNAEPAAEAALAAAAQGKFWEMHDKLFANQSALDRANLDKLAAELHLDLARFKADLDGKRYKAQIDAELAEGNLAGVHGTPAVFINGRRINGAYPYETFKQVAEQELAKKRAPAAAGH